MVNQVSANISRSRRGYSKDFHLSSFKDKLEYDISKVEEFNQVSAVFAKLPNLGKDYDTMRSELNRSNLTLDAACAIYMEPINDKSKMDEKVIFLDKKIENCLKK